jgi:hypothetical protein
MSPASAETCPLCGGAPLAEVTARWGLFLKMDAPSQNNHVMNAGAGRWRYKRERGVWETYLRIHKVSAGVPDAERRRRVTFERCYSGKQRIADIANIIGGLKLVVDAMVRCGLLVDDGPAHFEGYYKQRKVEAAERGTVITIEELA